MNPNNNSNLSSSSVLFTCPEVPPLPIGYQECRLQRRETDVHIKIGEQRSPAHRLVLVNSSPFLSTMLSVPWDPERNNDCELNERSVHPTIVNDLLDFFYTRKVTITMENAKLLCIAANFLEVPTLQAATEKFLAEQFQSSPGSVFDYFEFAIVHQLEYLHKACIKFVYENYESVLQNDKILDFADESILQLFEDLKALPSIMMLNEALFELLLKFDFTHRSDFMVTLLKCIPLLDLSENFLQNVIKKNIITSSQVCNKLVTDALNQLSSGSQLCHPPPTKKRKKSISYHIYSFGVETYEGVECAVSHYDVSAGKWKRRVEDEWVNPRNYFGATVVGDKVYMFGGWEEVRKSTNVADVYDTKRNTWAQLRPMPNSKGECAAVFLNGFIYVSGGAIHTYNSKNQIFFLKHSNVDRYCVATDEWTSVAPMLAPRSRHKLAVFNGYIYAFGGADSDQNYIEKYDPKANKWVRIAESWPYREASPLTAYQDKFCLLNEKDDGDELILFDPAKNDFETLQFEHANQEFVDEFSRMGTVSIDDKIWDLNVDNMFYEFDPATGDWKDLDIDFDIPHDTFQIVVIKR